MKEIIVSKKPFTLKISNPYSKGGEIAKLLITASIIIPFFSVIAYWMNYSSRKEGYSTSSLIIVFPLLLIAVGFWCIILVFLILTKKYTFLNKFYSPNVLINDEGINFYSRFDMTILSEYNWDIVEKAYLTVDNTHEYGVYRLDSYNGEMVG